MNEQNVKKGAKQALEKIQALDLIKQIVDRARSLDPEIDATYMMMDIDCVHSFCPLDLKRWLESDNSNFMHDIYGIRSHLNRREKKLERFFDPRFSLPCTCHDTDKPAIEHDCPIHPNLS